jgi:Dolichyl-phosphate-mannose-protein mannosyltransferase
MYADQMKEASRLATRPISGELLTVLALSGIALLLRVVVAERGGLWRDEGLFLFVVRSDSWSSMLDFLRMHESHPPLFYAIMRVWLSIFGGSDRAAIALPIALGVILVPAIYFVGASLFSRRIGLLAAALAALSPALTEYSAQVRPYSLMPLLALLSSYALIRGLERGGWRSWASYVLSTLALVYTHNWGWLVVGGQWASVLVSLTLGTNRPRDKVTREWFLAQIMIAIGFLPWAPWLIYQATHAGHVPSHYSQDGIAVYVTNAARDWLQATLLAYPAIDDASFGADSGWFLALPVMLLGADQFLRARRTQKIPATPVDVPRLDIGVNGRKTALIVLLVVPFSAWLAAVALSRRSDLLPARCLATLAPLLLLGLAWWLSRPRTGAMLYLSRAAVAALMMTYAATLYDLTQTTRSNAREFAPAIAAKTQPSDLVIVAPEWMASSFNRYYTPSAEQIDYPHLGREGAVDFSDMRRRIIDPQAFATVQQRIAEARQAGRRTWLIMDRGDVLQISPGRMIRLLNSADYAVVAITRSNQIRAELVSMYGPPDTSVMVSGPRTRYEHFRAFLFTPAG